MRLWLLTELPDFVRERLDLLRKPLRVGRDGAEVTLGRMARLRMMVQNDKEL